MRYLDGDVLQSTIASPAVWKILLLVRGRMVCSELHHMLDLVGRVPGTASSAGWLWESLCHTKIREGGSFTLKIMAVTSTGVLAPSDVNATISVPRLEPQVFNSNDLISSTRDATKYYIPFDRSNPTFDSFFHLENIGVGVQIILRPNHELDVKGLRMLYGRMGEGSADKNWFVFVIREGSVFKCKKPSAVQMRRFSFYTLELPIPPREHHFPSRTGLSTDDVDVAEVEPTLFDEAVEMDRGGPLELPPDDNRSTLVGDEGGRGRGRGRGRGGRGRGRGGRG